MTLTAKDVAEISRLLEASSFDELTLELEGLKLTLRRGGAAAPAGPTAAERPGLTAAPKTGAEPRRGEAAAGTDAAVGTEPDPAPAPRAGEALHEVTAPLLGTFYRAPKPGAPPFVEIGSAVEPDTIIGIIEVMKLMNTVRAGMRGQVSDILAQDGALVEYGETLMRVCPASRD